MERRDSGVATQGLWRAKQDPVGTETYRIRPCIQLAALILYNQNRSNCPKSVSMWQQLQWSQTPSSCSCIIVHCANWIQALTRDCIFKESLIQDWHCSHKTHDSWEPDHHNCACLCPSTNTRAEKWQWLQQISVRATKPTTFVTEQKAQH